MNKVGFKKFTLFILILVISFSFTFLPPKQVHAQAIVSDILGGVWSGIQWAGDKAAEAFKYAYDKGGAVAFQQTLRAALNKIAIDSATWIASGDKGQKPLFITEGTGAYFANIADEAAGQFIESFVNNWNVSQQDDYQSGLGNCEESFNACRASCISGLVPNLIIDQDCVDNCLVENNKCLGDFAAARPGTAARPVAVCQPSSIDVKLRISLGLVDYARPRAPNCTASDLVKNWSDELSRLDPRTWDDRDFINRLTGIFHPTQSDLGIALTLQSDLEAAKGLEEKVAQLNWDAGGRFLDVIGISGNIESLPGQAQMEAEIAQTSRIENLSKYTGDAFVDAANIFINTLALQYYNRLMQGFGKTVDEFQSVDLTDPDIDPSIRFGDVRIEEKISQILKPAFSQQADYNIVSDLSICPDPNNPGVTDCVIDTNLMQAVYEEKTVIEAIRDRSLRANWLLTTDNSRGKDNAYTLRNISILRKHRILPVGWEIAASLNEGRGATLLDLVSCFDINDDFQEFSDSFDLRDTAWCQGLIDPYWVLKAPLSFCAKQGIGSQILNTQILAGQSGMPNSPDIPSRLSVTRDESYCADDLTCIKEDPNSGACLAYGYCNEEKRIWTFDYPSCEPVYNTCTAFTDPQGAQIAYLENTLDYGICSEENAGCLPYYTRGNYQLASGQINWETSPLIYFNNKLASCSAQNEGCSELMRVKPSWGSNLIMGADFQYYEPGVIFGEVDGEIVSDSYWNFSGDGTAEIVDGQAVGFSGQKLLKLETENIISLSSNDSNSLIPDNFPLIPGYSYTLSADVYIQSGSGVKLVIGDDETFSQTTTSGSWQRLFQTYHLDVNTPQISSLAFNIENLGTGGTFYLRNLKLEISSWANNYSPYGSYKIYQKLIPQYLENVCYQDYSSATKDYRLKDNAPAICNNFARQCNIDEVGCVMLTNQKHNLSIPAQPVTSDYCPRECEDYNVYVAQASHFYNPYVENLIPYNSSVCSANAVGCTEFTNLDDVASGGERREYYTHLKHCIKPDENKCANFYTWEGDDESGYQLRVMSLEKDGEHPKLTSEDNSCTAATYNLSPFNPDFNPDCRQFYNQAGDVSYRLMSKTITCSENCHSYRMTENNIDYSIITQAECNNIGDAWLDNQCVVCKNNGDWSSNHNACLYQAIPGEGKSCSANMAGCREYSGSDGSNVRMVAAYDFQAGSAGWTGYCDQVVALSNVSVSQNGRSLWYQNNPVTVCSSLSEPGEGIGINLGYNLRQNKSYSIRLLARAKDSDAQVEFSFANTESDDIKFYPDPITIKAGVWQVYELNLPNFNRSVDPDEHLIIKSNNDFYIDNITIKEVSDRFYLIKNTSQIPDVCYYDILDNYQGADYNLGCSRWSDNLGNAHFLRKISKLCHESSVGCELMIDTNNSSDWRTKTVCDPSNEHCVDVAGDEFISAIYDRTKVCLSDNKGCSRMGQVVGEGTNQVISTVYRKNNSENYSNSLCSEEAVNCQQWKTDTGFQYFKDPKNNACVYRHVRDSDFSSNIKHWFMKDVKRCDLGNNNFGNICSSDDDCPGACVLDQTDYPCAVSYFQTIGLGGLMGRLPTPSMQAGICDLEASGCTEYIDPVSQFSPNLLINPNFQGSSNDGWALGAEDEDEYEQDINLTPNTLYLFTSSIAGVKIEFERDARLFNMDENDFSDTVIGEEEDYLIEIEYADEKIYFHSQLNETAKIIGGVDGETIVVKPVIVDYQLKQNVDYESCNGLVNFNNGCVLFNERSFNGVNGLSQLNLNAFASETNSPPKLCSDDDCNANQLIKVKPDRTCGRWLDCRTYIDNPDTGERTCYDIGECTHLNDKNECINFTSFKDEDDEPIVFNYFEHSIHNITGYSLLDHYYIGEMHEVGLNTNVHYDFETTNIALHCEVGIESAYSHSPNVRGGCNFDDNIVADSLVIEPDKATTDYPAQGKGYLKVLAYYQMAPHSQNETFQLIEDQKYYINFLLNTKDAEIDGRIMLYDFDNEEVVWERPASAHNGWERKVFEIDTGKDDIKDSLGSLQIFLTADTNNLEERYVYFDDIHIEPVLKVGPTEYVAKDCRLYPEVDSLSCSTANDNIIRHGLEGYCLERDPVNNNVCLTWYPVDQISSSRLSTTVGGYQGKQPLYYCAEADGNFELLEKRVPIKIATREHKDFDTYFEVHSYISGYSGSDTFCALVNPWRCNLNKDGRYNYFALYERRGEEAAVYCVPKLNVINRAFIGYPVVAKNVLLPNSLGICDNAIVARMRAASIPDNQRPFTVRDGIDLTPGIYEIWDVFDGLANESLLIDPNHYKGDDCDDCTPFIRETENHIPPIAVYDYNNPPNFEEDLKFISHDNVDKVYQPTCSRFVQLVDPYGVNKAWAGRVSRSSDPYLTPNWMTKSIEKHPFYNEDFVPEGNYGCQFRESNLPQCYQDLMCNTHSGDYNHADCEFHPDTQRWEPPGCCADSKRNYCAPDDPPECIETQEGTEVICDGIDPDFCSNITDPGVCNANEHCEYIDHPEFDQSEPFIRYGQNREDVPYGSAILPENFNFYNSLPVQFRNQYSERNNQTIFAGRPYGCDGPGCKNLGQCSLNPNVYCIYDPSNWTGSKKINADSCAKGNFGTCTPLWQGDYEYLTSKDPNYFFEFPLRTLFLKSFGGFEFNYQEEGGYESTVGGYSCAGSEDYYDPPGGDICDFDRMPECIGSRPNYEDEDNDESSWCVIYPTIENVFLYKVDYIDQLDYEPDYDPIEITSDSNGEIELKPGPGLYYLQFNSIVDLEQQPLRQIEISWGDGDFQVLSDQGHRPNEDNSHRIYHFYSGDELVNFNIKIIDNWGAWDRYLELSLIW